MSPLTWLKTKRVAVLKGGWSKERNISLKTGAAVEQSLRRLGIRPLSIDANRNLAVTLQKKKIQFCFIALHGPFGEDGTVQGCLDLLGIPYTGSGTLASAVAMDKNVSKKLFAYHGVPTAPWMVLSREEFKANSERTQEELARLFAHGPVFVKPVDQGSAIGVSRVDKLSDCPAALKACFKVSDRAMIETFIEGVELTVGILGEQTLPVVEIVPAHSFYDFHSKYAKGGSKHIVPARVSARTIDDAQDVSLRAFKALGCSTYGRVDLIVNRDLKVFVLEVNTIPGMTATSLLPDAAHAAGINFDQLVLRIIEESLKKHHLV